MCAHTYMCILCVFVCLYIYVPLCIHSYMYLYIYVCVCIYNARLPSCSMNKTMI